LHCNFAYRNELDRCFLRAPQFSGHKDSDGLLLVNLDSLNTKNAAVRIADDSAYVDPPLCSHSKSSRPVRPQNVSNRVWFL
jgi:hypothetical protein